MTPAIKALTMKQEKVLESSDLRQGHWMNFQNLVNMLLLITSNQYFL